jgi:hypothetical protein
MNRRKRPENRIDDATSACAAAQPAMPPPRGSQHATLIDLQRSAGTAAVMRYLAENGALPPLTYRPNGHLLRSAERGRLAAEAARELPAGIDFGSLRPEESEQGIEFNPRYWTLRYYLQRPPSAPGRGNASQGSGRTPRANGYENYEAASEFWHSNPEWSRLIIRIRPNGDAHQALEDMFNPSSADKYAMDCHLAAAMVQFRAIHLQTLGETDAPTMTDAGLATRAQRIAAFNARWGHHLFRSEGKRVEGFSANLGLAKVDIGGDIHLHQWHPDARDLRIGDWVTITCLRLPEDHAFYNENATYLGGGRFHGHPIGEFTLYEYAVYLRDHLNVFMMQNMSGNPEWLLERSVLRGTVMRPSGTPGLGALRFVGADRSSAE